MLGTDAEAGQSGSSSPRKTMLKSGHVPGMHISPQMATATFSSSNHKRLPLLIMCIMTFIFLFKEGGLLLSPSSIFLNLFIGSHHTLRFPLRHLFSFKPPQAKIILSVQYIPAWYAAGLMELLPEHYVNQTHMLSKTVMQCNECLSTIIQL